MEASKENECVVSRDSFPSMPSLSLSLSLSSNGLVSLCSSLSLPFLARHACSDTTLGLAHRGRETERENENERKRETPRAREIGEERNFFHRGAPSFRSRFFFVNLDLLLLLTLTFFKTPSTTPTPYPPPRQQQKQEKKKKWEPPAPPPRIGRKQRRRDAAAGAAGRLPAVVPTAKCRLRLLKLERLKDWLLMEEEFVASHEALKPKPAGGAGGGMDVDEEEDGDRSKVDDLRGSPMSVGTLEEIVDESHAIVSSSVGPEYYVTIMSFVDRSLLEPGCSVLLHNKVRRKRRGEKESLRTTKKKTRKELTTKNFSTRMKKPFKTLFKGSLHRRRAGRRRRPDGVGHEGRQGPPGDVRRRR